MQPAEILALYDAQMRRDPPQEKGLTIERVDGVTRLTGPFNVITHAELAADAVDAAIAAQAAHFRALGRKVEWKVYAHDRPADLAARLAAAGFESDEQETLLAFDMETHGLPAEPAPGVDVRRVTDQQGLLDFVAADALAFGKEERWPIDLYGDRLDDPSVRLYVAYVDGRPIAGGRLELPQGRIFAGLWGGGTAPEHRHRGVYRTMVATRAAEARRRGHRILFVEARDTSRPILERMGFQVISRLAGWTLKP